MNRIIEIKGLSVMAFVGVPDEERAEEQRLCLDVKFMALLQPESLCEDLTKTVDYAAVSQRVIELVKIKPRKLIETLADEVAKTLLIEFSLCSIEVTVRKFIIPNSEWVSVSTCLEM